MRLLDAIKSASTRLLFLVMFVLIGVPLIASTVWALLHPVEHFGTIVAFAFFWLTLLCGVVAARSGD